MLVNVAQQNPMPWEVFAVRRLARLVHPEAVVAFRARFFLVALNPTARPAAVTMYRRRMTRRESK